MLPQPSLTGFLVQPNGSPLRRDIPSLHQSTLEAILQKTNIEKDIGPFLSDITARLPVALVYAPRIDGQNSLNLFIAPEEVLSQRGPKAWRLELDMSEKQHQVLIVKRATPIP